MFLSRRESQQTEKELSKKEKTHEYLTLTLTGKLVRENQKKKIWKNKK